LRSFTSGSATRPKFRADRFNPVTSVRDVMTFL
jgi:hypothetical protein